MMSGVSAKYTYIVCITLCFMCGSAIGQKTGCSESQVCVPLKNCLSVNQKLYKKDLLQSDITHLQSLQCGYLKDTVYVCCESSLPKPPDCGPFILSSRIVGGDITRIDEYPWTVLIGTLISVSDDGEEKIKYSCGGSLINDQYVVTAAHCIKIETKDYKIVTRNISTIRLGEWNLNNDMDSETDPNTNITIRADPIVNVKVEKLIVHQKYHPSSKFYDIALIKLAERVNFTRFIMPICLPDKSQQIEEDLIVVGWGRTENKTRSDLKRFASIPLWNLTDCAEAYKSKANVDINRTQLCAGAVGIDSCQGDSGGPLVGYNASNAFQIYHYLAGIVSFGVRDCGKGTLPGIYTNTKSYLRWINENIEHYG